MTHKYKIRFFAAYSGAYNKGRTVESMFKEILERGGTWPVKIMTSTFEIRDLFETSEGFTGVFAKVRTDDLPHAGSAGGAERELDLVDGEGLLEKLHFFFAKTYQILAVQQNPSVGGSGRLGSYLTQAFKETISFNPILQKDAARRLLLGDVKVKSYDVSIARPSSMVLDEIERLDEGWNKSMMEIMNSTGAYTLKMVVKGDGHSRTDKRFLGAGLLRSFANLSELTHVKRARVVVQGAGENDQPGEVDLIQDRIQDEVKVEKRGRYPNSEGMWNELQRVWGANRQEIIEVLGFETPGSH